LRRNGKSTPSARRQDTESYKAILRAAIEVFADKGYHGCRISDVAREAGVAYGLVYHYFHDKEALLEAVFEVGWGGFLARVREVAVSASTLEEKVRRIAQIAFEAYRRDPKAVKVIILEIARSPAFEQARHRSELMDVIRVSEGMFVEAKRSRDLNPKLDPLLCAAQLFGAIEMALTTFVLGLADSQTAQALERAQVQLTESFLHGVLADDSIQRPGDHHLRGDRRGRQPRPVPPSPIHSR
jgi:TetR/AcrR family fatty acid metabolism transcriptional regulator